MVKIERLTKYLPAIPVVAFVLALLHEMGLCFGLGFSVLRFYTPTDFLSISIQFVLPSLLPFGYLIISHTFDPLIIPSTATRKQLWIIWSIAIVPVVLMFCYEFLVGFSSDFYYGWLGLPLIILCLVAIGSIKSLEGIRSILGMFLISIVLVFLGGTREGNIFRLANDNEQPEVHFDNPPTSAKSFFMIRMLSSGTLVIDEQSVVSFVRTEEVSSVTKQVDPKIWKRVLCESYSICGY